MEKITEALVALTNEQRCHAYVQINCWEWPEALAAFKPEAYDKMDNKEKYESLEWDYVFRWLMSNTTEFDRSEQWWKEQNLGDAAAHAKWWGSRPRE